MHWKSSLKAPESHVEAFHRVSSSISANLASEFHMEVFTCVLLASLQILASEFHKASIHNHVLSKASQVGPLSNFAEAYFKIANNGLLPHKRLELALLYMAQDGEPFCACASQWHLCTS